METLNPESNVKKKASPKYAELRERGVRMVFDHQHEYETQWAAQRRRYCQSNVMDSQAGLKAPPDKRRL